MALGKEIF